MNNTRPIRVHFGDQLLEFNVPINGDLTGYELSIPVITNFNGVRKETIVRTPLSRFIQLRTTPPPSL